MPNIVVLEWNTSFYNKIEYYPSPEKDAGPTHVRIYNKVIIGQAVGQLTNIYIYTIIRHYCTLLASSTDRDLVQQAIDNCFFVKHTATQFYYHRVSIAVMDLGYAAVLQFQSKGIQLSSHQNGILQGFALVHLDLAIAILPGIYLASLAFLLYKYKIYTQMLSIRLYMELGKRITPAS